jgi:hypothetical protein
MSEDLDALIKELKELRLKEAAVIERIEAVTRRGSERLVEKGAYEAGDRIYINNNIRRPLRASPNWSAASERRATVTDVKGDRVHFVTDNGTKTWREQKSVRAIVKHE